MVRPAAAQAARAAAARPVVKLVGSPVVAAERAALQADVAAQEESRADAAVVAAAETSDAAVLNCDDRRSHRTLNPRSSFYPPISVFRLLAQSPCARPAALTLSRERGNREPDTAKAPIDRMSA